MARGLLDCRSLATPLLPCHGLVGGKSTRSSSGIHERPGRRSLVFAATCSRPIWCFSTRIYFEGEGGETIGRRGNSKDHVLTPTWTPTASPTRKAFPHWFDLLAAITHRNPNAPTNRGQHHHPNPHTNRHSYFHKGYRRPSTPNPLESYEPTPSPPEVALKYKQLWMVEQTDCEVILDERATFSNCCGVW